MRCENCGAEIPEGHLYCENCGEEIHIVPMFEPEVEIELGEAMQRIQDDVAGQFESKPAQKPQKKHHYLRWVIMLVVISILAAAVALNYLYKSPYYQVKRGDNFYADGEYLKAIECYERAMSYDSTSEPALYLDIAVCYERLGYEGQYESSLLEIIYHPLADEQEISLAYAKLITFYINGKNYSTINSLLKSCDNVKIISIYEEFMVSLPKFSHEPGYYREIVPLKITSSKGDTVHYTTDGSTPTTESPVYSTPIFLEAGEYEIQAICVDVNGVVSDVVVGEYQIDF